MERARNELFHSLAFIGSRISRKSCIFHIRGIDKYNFPELQLSLKNTKCLDINKFSKFTH